MSSAAPRILPASEKAKFANNLFQRKVLKKEVPPYRPQFLKACKHIILHPGARGVIEGMALALGMPLDSQEPSMNALYWYGNTSGASLWYALGWLETVQGVGRGERVMQIGLGAGFECSTSVWRALHPIKTTHNAWNHVLGGKEGEAKEIFMKCVAGEVPFPKTHRVQSKLSLASVRN